MFKSSGVAGGNRLYFGDNLDVLRSMAADSVDLIYLDPPFNSKADYGVIYGTARGGPSQAQSHAFDDMWKWGEDAKRALDETAERHLEAGALLDSFQRVFPNSNMLAYLAMMAVRLIEMRRVLKATGSLYLHCDPTASSYLRVLLDAIFGTERFLNEIVWQRTGAHNDARRFGRITDSILLFSKSSAYVFHPQFQEYDPEYVAERYRYRDPDGRLFWPNTATSPSPRPNMMYEWKGNQSPPNGWRFERATMERLERQNRLYYSKTGMVYVKNYLDEQKGRAAQNLWTDIVMEKSGSERLGYSTQKPLALLERIIMASSNEGDVILDPFCGCGTAVEAAQKLRRQWIGIDVTYLAIHVIEARLVKAFGASIKNNYQLFGRPKDANDARALAARDWLEFQKWAVFMLGGLPKDRPGADGGIDGIIRYHRVGIEQPNRAVVSVKGGHNVGVDAIHKLKSVVKREGAEIGILVCLNNPGAPMRNEAFSEGDVGPSSRKVQKIQIITVDELFTRHPVDLPGMIDPPEIVSSSPAFQQTKRGRKVAAGQTEMLFALDNTKEGTAKPIKRNRQIRPVEIEVTRAGSRKRK
ncbi:MAG TPA: DNA methyltransferase [Bradyrhizobium sp.]|nr:DNA methyltransferase [Bradyrhizobium sp.]